MKRIIPLIFGLLLMAAGAFFIPGGGLDIFFANDAVEAVESTAHIGLSSGKLFEDSHETIITAQEAAGFSSSASQYRSSLHYNSLSENEQLLYRVLEYAMENGYTNILVDDLLVDDMETLENVLFSLAYDSPLLEQNLRYEVGDFTTYHDVSVLKYFTRSAAFDGYYLCVNNFQPQWWEKKQEALQAAQAVVDALPDGLSPIETAERLYRHVADTVTYTEYPEDSDDAVYPYLYDGLITGKTHCDGYTNALALLLRLAGIENAEKDYAPDDSEEVGHTWNCMEIDGKWYNVDAVGEEYIPNGSTAMHAGYYFAFADALLEYPTRNAEAFPACEESFYMPVDGTFDSSDASGLPSAIVRGYDRHDDLWALVIITDYDDSDMDYQLQEVANRLWDTVYWMYFPLHDGRTALLVYDGSLYD